MLTNIAHFLLSISFQFFACFVIRCFIFKLTDNFVSSDDINNEGITYSSTVCTNMSSSTQPAEEETEDKTTMSSRGLEIVKDRSLDVDPVEGIEKEDIKVPEEDTECGDSSSRTSSYRLYIATSVAVFAAICSVGQFDTLSSFAEIFSSSLCDTSSLDILAEESNTTTSPDFGLSSKFDPIFKDGEKYDALSAIQSRYT